MRSRSNGGVIGAYQLPTQNFANGVFFIHDAAIYNTGNNPIWPLGTGFIYSASGGTISTAVDNSNYKLHTFTANGTFTISTGAAYIDILLVGGGGAGGFANNVTYGKGGGGAGGQVLLMEQVFVNGPTTFTVEVGQGGAATLPNATNQLLASLPGKPSKVTSPAGHSMISYGGGAGNSEYSTSVYDTGTSSVSGGGQSSSIYRSANTLTSVTLTRTVYGSGTPGIVNNKVYPSGGASMYAVQQNFAVAGGPGNAGGGGAGATENGYPGYNSFDTTLSAAGGNGYQWSRTGYWYGGGGPGGQTYGYPMATYGVRFGLCGTTSNRQVSLNGWAYSNSNLSTGQNGADGAINFGGGGQGAAIYSIGGNNGNGARGGNGGTGTVIFCYRYQ